MAEGIQENSGRPDNDIDMRQSGIPKLLVGLFVHTIVPCKRNNSIRREIVRKRLVLLLGEKLRRCHEPNELPRIRS